MVKYIELSKYQVTEVDDEDFEYLNQWKWHASMNYKNCYAKRTQTVIENGVKKGKSVYMHREIIKRMLIEEKNIDLFVDFISKPKEFIVDHISHFGLRNRRNNLRIVSQRQNQQNRRGKKSSKYPGVRLDKSKKKWESKILYKGHYIHLGTYADEKEAAKVYERACKLLDNEEVI